MMAKLRCAAGLAAMDSKKYKQAAMRFTEVCIGDCRGAQRQPNASAACFAQVSGRQTARQRVQRQRNH